MARWGIVGKMRKGRRQMAEGGSVTGFFDGDRRCSKHAFCETNPNVIWVNYAVSRCNGVGWVDYRKITNGFVLTENGNRDGGERAARPTIRKWRSWSEVPMVLDGHDRAWPSI